MDTGPSLLCTQQHQSTTDESEEDIPMQMNGSCLETDDDDSDYNYNPNSNAMYHHRHYEPEEPPLNADINSTYVKAKGAVHIMAQLHELEQQFWTQRHVDNLRRNAGKGNNNATGLSTTMECFKCCPQGASISSKDYHVITPGPFHSCPTLHLHGDNFYIPPASEQGASALIEAVQNKVETRVNNLKGMPIASSRIQKKKPPCKVCSPFAVSSKELEAAITDPDSIYETYKRNCTYRDCFDKQESVDPSKDPAEPIRNLFSSGGKPTLEEIGKVLIPGPLSSTTPANWVEELIQLLDPNPNSTKTKDQEAESQGAGYKKRVTVRRPKRFPKLNLDVSMSRRNSATVTVKDSTMALHLAMAPSATGNNTNVLLQQTSKPVSLKKHSKMYLRKLRQVKSRYLDHFQKSKQKVVDATTNVTNVTITNGASGDSRQLVKRLTGFVSAGNVTRVVAVATVGGQGDADHNSTKPVGPSPSSILRVSRPTTATLKKSNWSNRLHNLLQRIGPSKSKKRLNKSQTIKRSEGKKKHKEHKSKPMRTFRSTIEAKSSVKNENHDRETGTNKAVSKVPRTRRRIRRHRDPTRKAKVVKGCGFEFEDVESLKQSQLLNSDISKKCQPIARRKPHHRSRRHRRKSDKKNSDEPSQEEKEKYKQTILKMLENGGLLGTSMSGTSPVQTRTISMSQVGDKVNEESPEKKQMDIFMKSINEAQSRATQVLRSNWAASFTKSQKSEADIVNDRQNSIISHAVLSGLRIGLLSKPTHAPVHQLKLDLDLPNDFKPTTIPIPVTAASNIKIIHEPSVICAPSSKSKVVSLSKYSLISREQHSMIEDRIAVSARPNTSTAKISLESVISTRKLIPLAAARRQKSSTKLEE